MRSRGSGRRLLAGLLAGLLATTILAGCGKPSAPTQGALEVLATTTFLADIAQNVAGDRFTVQSLIPRDADLHAFEPTTRDLARADSADLVIINGDGLEGRLETSLRGAAAATTFVVAARGQTPRTPQAGEPSQEHGTGQERDPHYWLDPTRVTAYVEAISDAFAAADPQGAATYEANASAYIRELRALDSWIQNQVATLPAKDRLLVMNHVSHGYFADRYGFRIIGAVMPSVASDEPPTARQLAELTRTIREQRVRAIFVERGENRQLADQIAAETGVDIVDDLRDHSLSEPGGGAATYIEMMRFDTARIVAALRS